MRRLLLITYYFPPSGGSGVQRALKFAKYLPEMGWMPTVLTVDPEQAAYPEFDPSLGEEIPDSVRIERTPVWDPYEIYARLLGRDKQSTVVTGLESGAGWKHQLSRWIRANVFLPDARVGWVPHAARRAGQLLASDGDAAGSKDRKIDAVMTTGPPHSTHLVGLYLKKRHGLPWLADLRDPWTKIYYNEALPMSAPARWLDAFMERKVLQTADAVTTVSPALREALGQQATGRIAVMPNGFDPADFERMADLETVADTKKTGDSESTADTKKMAETEKTADTSDIHPPGGPPNPHDLQQLFRIGYTGNLSEAKNPEALWRAMGQVKTELPKLQVALTGSIDPYVLRSARDQGLDTCLTVSDYVPHAEATRRMKQSDLLLLAIPRGASAKGVITGKIFEYLASGRPVLALGPPDGDAADILRTTSGGEMYAHDDVDGVTAAIRRHYSAWESGEPLGGATRTAAAPYSRRAQARELADLLTEISAFSPV